ncbi:MAG: hypothetical protein ACK4PI_06075 [Tepidisphaerales bacterium]
MTRQPMPSQPPPEPDVLRYTPVSADRRRAGQLRGALLALAILLWLLGGIAVVWPELYTRLGIDSIVGLWGTPLQPINTNDGRPRWYAREPLAFDGPYVAASLAFLGLVLWAQWALLTPAGSWRPQVIAHGRPALRSAIAAGLMGMLTTVALLATLTELAGVWESLTTRVESIRGTGSTDLLQDFRPLWVGMAVLWLVWATLFWGYFRTESHHSAVARTLRWLLAPSLLSVLLAGPVHATRTGECHCAKGSYTGLVLGITAAVWLFGPAIFLLYWREKRRATGASFR